MYGLEWYTVFVPVLHLLCVWVGSTTLRSHELVLQKETGKPLPSLIRKLGPPLVLWETTMYVRLTKY